MLNSMTTWKVRCLAAGSAFGGGLSFSISLAFKFQLWLNWMPDLPYNVYETDTGLL